MAFKIQFNLILAFTCHTSELHIDLGIMVSWTAPLHRKKKKQYVLMGLSCVRLDETQDLGLKGFEAECLRIYD